MNKFRRILGLLAMAATLCFKAQAQLEVKPAYDYDQLISQTFVQKNAGVQVQAVKYIGAKAAIGTFECKMVYNEFIKSGIVLTTGYLSSIVGPNESGYTSGRNMESGLPMLEKLAGNQKTYDAAVLAFDFTSENDTICFRYCFASEEYPEYVNRNVNDVFGFYLIDLETGEIKNLATLPDGKTPICVDAINHLKNKEYFVLNGLWEKDNIRKWQNDRVKGELALHFGFDGFTTILSTGSRVLPQHRYRLIMAIADVGDDLYDSAIFLEAGSFGTAYNSPFQKLFANSNNTGDAQIFSADKAINFAFGSAEISAQSKPFLDSLAQMVLNGNLEKLEIIGHTDSVGTNANNMALSLQRAEAVKSYLQTQGVSSKLLIASGKGELEPLATTNDEKNRRVEFRFFLK